MSHALARFLCCERSCWQATTMPVGRWVMRIAESVLLTCWPPAPDARKVSMRQSFSLISMLILSSITGDTETAAKLVWRRAWLSNGLMRTRRCTPASVFSQP